MRRAIVLTACATAAMLSVAASAPAAAQSGLYDYPGEYAGRFDGVSPGATTKKGQVGANQALTVGGNRTIPVGGRAKRGTSDPDRPVVLGTVPNPKGQAKGAGSRYPRMSQPPAGASSQFGGQIDSMMNNNLSFPRSKSRKPKSLRGNRIGK